MVADLGNTSMLPRPPLCYECRKRGIATSNGVALLATRPRIFWGKVIWVLIQRGWQPPKPDERIVADLLEAFSTVTQRAENTDHVHYNLTRRQLDLLPLIANGYSNDEIARELELAPQTVKFHMKALLDRMEAKNRAHAVALAFRAQMLK